MKIGTTEIVWKMVSQRYLVSALSDVFLCYAEKYFCLIFGVSLSALASHGVVVCLLRIAALFHTGCLPDMYYTTRGVVTTRSFSRCPLVACLTCKTDM